MFRPARVLPSNAPPLSIESQPSSVLQEHSSTSDSGDGPEHDLKHFPGHQIVHQPPHTAQQLQSQGHEYRYGGSSYHSEDKNQAQAKNEKLARQVYQRFKAADSFAKYRSRQPKGDKSGDQKWSDRVEFAFIQALVKWPPMGRRQILHKGRQHGRNELISDYIQEVTGEVRTRKQVSSHIQQLKPFVLHDPHIMKWLSGGGSSGQHAGRLSGGRALSYYDGESASNNADTGLRGTGRPRAPLLSHSDVQHLAKDKSSLDLFKPTDFSMFVQQKHGENAVERLHTYTHSITQPLQADIELLHGRAFKANFPLLYSLHQRQPLECNVLVAEASLAFPSNNFKDKDGAALPGVELGISLLCSSRNLPAHAQVRCFNTFYKDGHLLRDQSAPNEVHLTQSEDGISAETQLKFGSTFWAKTLGLLGGKFRSTTDAAQDTREEISEYVQGITAMQEITVMTDTGHERLLLIYWKFRLSSAETGRAYWMRLLLPTSSEQADPQIERVDSAYDYGLGFPGSTTSHASQASPPVLQSPFEYDGAPGSALSSTAWPRSVAHDSTAAPHSGADWHNNNAFNVNGGNININLSYDPPIDFNTFDSSAFNFDTAAAATPEFATDSTLRDFSQLSPDYSQYQVYSQATNFSTPWCGGLSEPFGGQRSVTGGSSRYDGLPTGTQSHVFDSYKADDHSYGAVSERQAYGGA